MVCIPAPQSPRNQKSFVHTLTRKGPKAESHVGQLGGMLRLHERRTSRSHRSEQLGKLGLAGHSQRLSFGSGSGLKASPEKRFNAGRWPQALAPTAVGPSGLRRSAWQGQQGERAKQRGKAELRRLLAAGPVLGLSSSSKRHPWHYAELVSRCEPLSLRLRPRRPGLMKLISRRRWRDLANSRRPAFDATMNHRLHSALQSDQGPNAFGFGRGFGGGGFAPGGGPLAFGT